MSVHRYFQLLRRLWYIGLNTNARLLFENPATTAQALEEMVNDGECVGVIQCPQEASGRPHRLHLNVLTELFNCFAQMKPQKVRTIIVSLKRNNQRACSGISENYSSWQQFLAMEKFESQFLHPFHLHIAQKSGQRGETTGLIITGNYIFLQYVDVCVDVML